MKTYLALRMHSILAILVMPYVIGPGIAAPQVTATTTSPLDTPTPTNTLPPVLHYGQCGGVGYTGSTVCVEPYQCVAIEDIWVSLVFPFGIIRCIHTLITPLFSIDVQFSQCI